MKGCLKLPSRAPSPASTQSAKHVVFDADGSEQVFFADEWDRTPAEPARNLSYQDILELKQIQRSLPRAIQPADITGTAHFLSTVPIGLLPLLPESDTAPPPASNIASTLSFSQNSWRTVCTPAPSISHTRTSVHPSNLSHLPPARPPIKRERSRFAFLPLLGTDNDGPPPHSPSPPSSPPPSERSSSPDHLLSDTASDLSHDPPTPALTSASLDNSPLSRASSCSPEPPFFQLPLSRNRARWGVPASSDDLIPSSSYLPSSRLSSAHSSSESLIHDPYDYRRPGYGASSKAVVVAQPIPIPKTPSTRKEERKRNVIVINGMEIELDDDKEQHDGDDEESASELEIEEGDNTPPAKPTFSIPPRDQIRSPTPSIARPLSPPDLSPPISLHTPIRFKRTSTPSPPVTKQTCSPPRNVTAAAHSNPLLVPSA